VLVLLMPELPADPLLLFDFEVLQHAQIDLHCC
jgi:hypothetical protein